VAVSAGWRRPSLSRDVDAAFRAYQNERVPRTARVQVSARQFGNIIHGDGDAAERRNTLLAQRTSDDYSHMDWFYAYQPQRSLSNEH
jgi:salicylate hydroxylase